MSPLTEGAIQRMNASEGQQGGDPAFAPVLQLMAVKAVGGSSDRYRTILSDGQHYVQGMLATQINHMVHSGQIADNSIVRVDDFMNNTVQNRTVIIVLGLTVMDTTAQRIGSPVDIEKAGLRTATTSAAPPQPMYNRTNQAPAHVPSAKPPAPTSRSNPNPYGGSGQSSSGHQNQNRYSGSSAPIVPSNSVGGGGGPPITPISQLNMYQNRWTIKARVTSKSDIRTWSNARGEGSLFSIELLDSSGMDVRATMFKEAVDKFYNFLEMDKVYTFSGGRLKVANMQYNTCKSNFEITFDQNSEIHLDNDNGEIQQQIYEFVKIADIEHTEAGKTIDVLGVVKGVGETQSLTSKKTGKELQKCDLTLVDDTGVEITMTVWGERARSAPTEFAHTPVCAFRRARVSDFGGKSLSASPTIVLQPRLPETGNLQTWWKSGGSQATRSLSSSGGGGGGKIEDLFHRKTISSIKNENMGYSNPDKPDWISFKGTFTFIKKDKDGGAWYCACANSGDPCKNRFKVNQTTDGNWFCDKCNGTYPNCVRRWIFSATVTDDTCTTWVSLFNEQAEVLLDGATADDVYNQTMGDNPDQDGYDSYFAKASFQEFLFKCKVKQENVGDETRVKTSVFSMQPVDYAKESRDLLSAISKF
mmetsp:Transcript_17342/g.26844  ORF Transcript_17342/g.26844 Transcript_17342/m.26844 type:complete len:643 (+) Transcript_17342:71-1999(+)|eukprot:CAMPEP_0195301386 /NCGR_PEP_ID=MMETSP0707-20130614/29208_1 /TAXON_ID=33640 /ORGANISM="Asterionellopsis glacialis, Strain CCMP134" /LENGTH=642 /DNA_ID=CAMNT_0040364317 /DNA_START=35 /DNA_END=1963 /DNA_ORIENTATION=-